MERQQELEINYTFPPQWSIYAALLAVLLSGVYHYFYDDAQRLGRACINNVKSASALPGEITEQIASVACSNPKDPRLPEWASKISASLVSERDASESIHQKVLPFASVLGFIAFFRIVPPILWVFFLRRIADIRRAATGR